MKLVGMISLPMATMVTGHSGDAVYEAGRYLAFDDTGAAWLLVERWERLEAHKRSAVVRVTFARWQLVDNLPVVREPPFALAMDRKAKGDAEP